MYHEPTTFVAQVVPRLLRLVPLNTKDGFPEGDMKVVQIEGVRRFLFLEFCPRQIILIYTLTQMGL